VVQKIGLVTYSTGNIKKLTESPSALGAEACWEGKSMANVTSGSLEAVEMILKDQKLFREAAYIDGNWIRKSASGTTKVDNPATGAVIGEVPNLGAAETRQAIEAAARALGPWQRETARPGRTSCAARSIC
jgi:hypothetical protein